MNHNRQNIDDHHAGEALDILATLADAETLEGATPEDVLASATDVTWCLVSERGDTDAEALVTKSLSDGIDIDHPAVADDQFVIHVATGDTADYGGGDYYHRCRITDGDGNMAVVLTGSFSIDH